MPYTTDARVRLEAGGIASIIDLPATDVTAIIAASDKLIDDKTDRVWVGTEDMYPIVQEVSALLSASLARRRFSDPEGKAEEQWYAGIALLIELVGEGGDTGLIVDKGEFATFPKNPNALWSRGRYSTTGISETSIDPDWIYSST